MFRIEYDVNIRPHAQRLFKISKQVQLFRCVVDIMPE